MSYRIYDASMPIHGDIQVYKNKEEKKPRFEVVANHSRNGVRETRIDMDLHTGTHVDAPLHMIAEGETLETYPLEQLVGPCRVLDLTQIQNVLKPEDFAEFDIQKGEFILCKTRNSFSDRFDFEFVYLSREAARYLAQMGVRGVGIDALGIERGQADHDTHKILFERGVVIIEGLRLKEIPPGKYFLLAAPLNILGVEAAPARVLLIDNGFGVVRC